VDLGLKGRVALVLASTSGLGLATARALSAEGARVAIAGRRMDVARTEAGRLDGAVALPADLSDRQSVAALPSAVRHALGPIDILVLNGPGPAPASARDVDLDAVRRGLDSLLLEHIRLTHDCLADMVPRGWGRILAIGSSGIESPLPNLAISNLGRSALAAYLKTLAAEVAGDGVTVNMLLPGRIATERTAELDRQSAQRQGIEPSDAERRSAATIPMRRYGQPAEFGAYAAFLCSESASYVTGSRVRCDGGLLRSL